jgi:hypothetical protein
MRRPTRPREHRAFAALAGGQVDRASGPGGEGDGDDLAALAGDHQGPVPPFQAQLPDIGTGGFGDPQPVQGEQGDERMLAGRSQPGGDEQSAELVAVQPDGMRFVVQAGTADVGGRGMVQEFFLDRAPVEPGDRRKPAGHGRGGPAAVFQVPGEQLDIGPPDREQRQRPVPAPCGELAQVQCIGFAGLAAVPGQEPGQRKPLRSGEHRLHGTRTVDVMVAVMGAPPDRCRDPDAGPAPRSQH